MNELIQENLFIERREPTISLESHIPEILPIFENIQKKIDFFLETNKIPHIIFHGSSGTGKRTIVYDFINKIYNNDKQKIKSNVMFVNCAHGKGIKFIREEVKFFAKSNIQSNSGVLFKIIVLLNADFLTIDAQSALRRCIELFSYNTRFFIIVENKYKLLNPILSRFCEIYVPEYIINNKVLILHQHHLNKKMNIREHEKEKQEMIQHKLFHPSSKGIQHSMLLNLSNEFYENGISCLDIMRFVEECGWWEEEKIVKYMMTFYDIKSEYRCEKLLMFYIFDMIYIQ
jgi:DNA polymerase III delta prime subunit